MPGEPPPSADEALERFLAYAGSRSLELYPAQEEAILALAEGHNVILNTPTGSGKSLVAAALHFFSLLRGRRSIYTCPIKALVNEKFFDLCRDFGPEQVGMMTGDATVNRDAPILCCTAEILANMACAGGEAAPVDDVIMDEFHYYGDRDRGVAWQIPLLTLKRARFLLMSATMSDGEWFGEKLTDLTGAPAAVVRSTDRPVPLAFSYVETPLDKTIGRLVETGKAPVYVVHFSRREAAENAQNFTSLALDNRAEREQIAAELETFRFSSPHGADIKRFLRQGIGLHHSGLLPKYRLLVEKLARAGLLKVICGTDTLGVGINVPIRTVVLSRLSKYDGEKSRILGARDFHQICGRAGRKGFDDEGWVVVQAPPHVIENKLQEEKAAGSGKKKKQHRKSPPKGFVSWDENTFDKLTAAAPERLQSSFRIDHGILLQLLARTGGSGCGAVRSLIRDCHEAPVARREHFRRAWQLFRSLLDRGIVEIPPRGEEGGKPEPRVNVELQPDFSLHQSLSLYLLDTLALLDPVDPGHALDVVTLAESIVENPDDILRSQLSKAKEKRLAELKAEGVEYDRRMAELDLVEYPKPRRDFIYDTFNQFADRHPWVGGENIRPKSIAREMIERWMSFADYIREYGLQRGEGLLLRHLTAVYKVLDQTVPREHKTPELWEMEAFLRETIQGVDSSLMEEWERLRHPERFTGQAAEPAISADTLPKRPGRERIEGLARAAVLARLRLIADGDWESLADGLDPRGDADGQPWTPERVAGLFAEYQREHDGPLLDPEGRNRRHTRFQKEGEGLVLEQILVDREGNNDWSLVFAVEEPEDPVLDQIRPRLLSGGPIGLF